MAANQAATYAAEIELLYTALASPYGISLSAEDAIKALPRLYNARRAAQDQALAILQFRPRNAECIWITKAGAQGQGASETEA